MATIVMPDGNQTFRDLIAADGSTPALEELGGVQVCLEGRVPDTETYLDRIRGARGIIAGWPLPEGVLAGSPDLEVISFLSTGVANFVDLEEAARRGVTICNTPGYGDVAVAEHALALIMSSLRDVPRLTEALHRVEWVYDETGMVTELSGSRVGLVGLGGIGMHLARLLRACGAEVVAWTRNPSEERAREAQVSFVSLEELFSTSRVVSLHLSLNSQTQGMVDAGLIARMQPGATLVNTARSGLVDLDALVSALRQERVRAALDVFPQEPLPADNELRGVPGLILTPHVGYNTPEAVQRMVALAVGNLAHFFKGEPRNVVTS